MRSGCLLCLAGVANYASFCFQSVSIVSDEGFKVWMCIICGWIYDEEKGAPEEGLKPGMRWEDVPDYWVCPDCGAGKEDFEMIEV
jgi:rubredoxin